MPPVARYSPSAASRSPLSGARFPFRGLFIASLALLTTVASASAQNKEKTKKVPKPDSLKKSLATKFFDSDSVVVATMTMNIDKIRHDKGQKVPWRAATWSYTGADGKQVNLPIKIKTRGIWRLKSCDFPPVRLDFAGKTTKGTMFEGLDKPKLVSYCRDDDKYEQYVLQEYQLYRAYNLLTPATHRARLVRLTYADSASGKTKTTRYAIILEEPNAMARRLGGRILAQKGAVAADLETHHALLVGVFQYLAANTDFSVNGLHNIELVSYPTGDVVPVAFDFDFSGAVNARYATVDPSLEISDVRRRLFRGYCGSSQDYGKIFALFNEKKDAIYGLYKDDLGKLLQPKVAGETLEYFDEFYKTINNSRTARREILENCKE